MRQNEVQDALSFVQRLSGPFDGVLKADDALRLAEEIESLGPWYLSEPADIGEGTMVAEPVDGNRARRHLEGLIEEILKEEKGVWSTMVYVQSREDPGLIKVFHPRRAGCGCGGGGGVLPWWVLSRMVPEPVPAWSGSACAVPEASGRGWLDRLFS